jgi:hypothetical protein
VQNLEEEAELIFATYTVGEAYVGKRSPDLHAPSFMQVVSHWEINSNSTVKLITKTIAELKANPNIGRAKALRRVMLLMIANGTNN